MASGLSYRQAHLCSYYVITISQVHSGTQQHYCSGMNYYNVVKLGNDIGLPNEHVNINRLDPY